MARINGIITATARVDSEDLLNVEFFVGLSQLLIILFLFELQCFGRNLPILLLNC